MTDQELEKLNLATFEAFAICGLTQAEDLMKKAKANDDLNQWVFAKGQMKAYKDLQKFIENYKENLKKES